MKNKTWLVITCLLVLPLIVVAFIGCTQPAPASPKPSPSSAPSTAPSPSPAPLPVTSPTVKPSPAPTGPKAFELSLWTAWPKNVLMTTEPYVDMLMDMVASKGKEVNISIKYRGGTEVFPSSEGLEAVGKGLVDIGWTSPWYYRGTVPEAAFMTFSQLTPWEERANGAYDMLNKWHMDKSNTVMWFRPPSRGWNGSYRVYLAVERAKPDLTGLKIRSVGLYDYIIKPLGGTPVNIAGPEIYSALERNIIQGYGWSAAGLRAYGWEQITKYLWGPLFFNTADSVVFNLNKWNSLDEKQRAFLTDVGKQMERDIQTKYEALYEAEVKLLKGMGIKEQRWDAETEKWYVKTAFDEAWKDQLKTYPEAAAKFKTLVVK